MANNCLVTKLKAVVDNPNLPRIDDFTFEIDSHLFSNYSASQIAGLFSLVGTNVSIEVNEDKTKATIHKINNVTEFQCYRGVGITCDINALIRGNLTRLNVGNVETPKVCEFNITGDVTKLPSTISYMSFPSLEFDIKDIGHITSLNYLVFVQNDIPGFYSNISGKVEDFVNAQIAAGRTAGTVYFGNYSVPTVPIVETVTFNNVILTGGCKVISWNYSGGNPNITVTDR